MFHPKGPTFFELARQALSSTEKGYDLLAPKFDYTPFRTPDWLLQAVANQLQALAPFGSGLDLCCGTGAGMHWLRPLCRDRVVGLDFSQGMLEVCREQLADAPGAARVELVRGNALALPFGPEFDVVVCFGAFGHILPRDEPRFVGEIARVLKPGGRFVFVTSFRPPLWSMDAWLAWLFNGAMHVRNVLISPPFIMYYLTFLLPEVKDLLEKHGLAVEVRELRRERFCPRLHLVTARKK
ncbi:MAG: methyltransferase domain-containing protein [Planctomycetes bacterium]|nr:methyltransferase domain-containing protein [Planctomycetota bacterium]